MIKVIIVNVKIKIQNLEHPQPKQTLMFAQKKVPKDMSKSIQVKKNLIACNAVSKGLAVVN